jgi:hypothetical protein
MGSLVPFYAQDDNKIVNYCNSEELKETAKSGLEEGFEYDALKLVKIKYIDEKQRYQIEVPLFFGEKYCLVFNREGLPQEVKIYVYDKNFESEKKELLFSSDNFPENQRQITWKPEKSRNMYVVYEVPETNDVFKEGCMVIVLGYYIKAIKFD